MLRGDRASVCAKVRCTGWVSWVNPTYNIIYDIIE